MGMFDSGGGPDFSLAGMILGGRGYAANWFQQRDQMLWAEAAQKKQDALEQQYGAALVNSPEYKAFRDNPMSRQAALDFWAHNMGAPGDIDTQGAGYVGTGLTAQYNKLQSDVNFANQQALANLQDRQQKENLQIASNLNLKETDYRTQKELELYNSKLAVDDGRKQAVLNSLADVPGEVAANLRYRAIFGNDALPADKSVGYGPDGSIYIRPATGSADHIKMMTQLNAGETLVSTLSDMSTQLERNQITGTYDWNTRVSNLSMVVKNLYEAGSLDEGLLNIVNDMIPKIAQVRDPGARERALEQLRATIEMTRQNNANVISNFSTPVTDLPAGKGDQKYFPNPRGDPPKRGSVTDAQKQIQPPKPAPSYGKEYNPEAPGSVFQ